MLQNTYNHITPASGFVNRHGYILSWECTSYSLTSQTIKWTLEVVSTVLNKWEGTLYVNNKATQNFTGSNTYTGTVTLTKAAGTYGKLNLTVITRTPYEYTHIHEDKVLTGDSLSHTTGTWGAYGVTQSYGISVEWERVSVTEGPNPSTTISWSMDYWGITSSSNYKSTAGKFYIDNVLVGDFSTNTTSGTYTIKHNSDGNKSFTMKLADGGSSTTKTSTLAPLRIPATLLTASNFNDEQFPSITYSNTAGDELEGLQLKFYSYDGNLLVTKDVPKTESSYKLTTLTEADKNALRRSVKTGNSATINYYLVSTINGTEYSSKLAKTLTLINYEPTLDPSIPIDTNSTTIALTGDDQILIRYHSNIFVETGAEAQKEATITSQYITNGKTTIHEGSATFTNVEKDTFYYSVTDSRGFTTQEELKINLIPYFKPTISLSVLPFSLNGDLTFTLVGKYFSGSFGARDNSFSVSYVIVESGQSLSTATYQYVPRSASTVVGDDYSTNYTISGLDANKSYQLMVRVQDSLDASYASRQSIAAAPLFDWSRTDFNFNVPVYLKDTEIPLENLKDYIVLQAEDGDWFYRLWYSGKVELFGTKDISGVACNNSLGNWYRTVVLSSPTYPFTINNAIVTVNYESDGYGAVVWPTTKSTTAQPFDFYLIRPTSSTGITGKVTYHVIGDLGGVIA